MTNLVIYESNSGAYEVRIEGESAWLNLDQLSVLFGRDRSVIGKHIRKIFSEEERNHWNEIRWRQGPRADRLFEWLYR